MDGEQSEAFPDELRDWVERRAAERETDPETILARAVAAYRALDAAAADSDLPAAADAERLDEVDDRLETLTDRVGAVEDDLDSKIQDVRERVVQIKRETDAKAPKDHAHPNLANRVDDAVRTAEDAEARVDDIADRLDQGFENYEEILEYLTDATDELDRKVDTLAGAVVDVRTELRRIAAAEHDRQAVDDLRTAANRHGTRTAVCADCDATVDLGLLSRPRCPHCEATYVEFEPATGFFSSATLATGDRPALAEAEGSGAPTDVPETPADLFDAGEAPDE
ncbi:CopG family transcriptional regulator [Haloplanus halobius]|uniref:CopG family transcriptional regulator n=1 Tax=Haloplanus halobius TaxID=2934938 RepID=UPI00200D40D5|nr:CopG family transcriptional regulator [Haloplanus sp. XH21]